MDLLSEKVQQVSEKRPGLSTGICAVDPYSNLQRRQEWV